MSERFYHIVRFAENNNIVEFKKELNSILDEKLEKKYIKTCQEMIVSEGVKAKSDYIIKDAKTRAKLTKLSRLAEGNKAKVEEAIKTKKHFTKFEAVDSVLKELYSNNKFLVKLQNHIVKALKENKEAKIDDEIVKFSINYLTTAKV